MSVLNLARHDDSEVFFKISKFPDGQQNITIEKLNFYSKNQEKVLIFSRLNNWMDLELICASVASLRALNVKVIDLYCPYILGARSDRKFEEGGNNYIKDVLAPVLNSLKLDSISCMDPHSDVLEACLNNFKYQTNLSLVSFAIKDRVKHDAKYDENLNKLVIVSPDSGANKKIFKLADRLNFKSDIITCSKSRDTEGKLSHLDVPIKLEHYDKDLFIIDDICDGGRTFVNIASKIKSDPEFKGRIFLIVTHGIFSAGFDELSKYFDGIYCTNSYKDIKPPLNYTENHQYIVDKVKQLNVFNR
jgi:ribose-phosphate pyrophosphokinase